jgi:hypothetical protein
MKTIKRNTLLMTILVIIIKTSFVFSSNLPDMTEKLTDNPLNKTNKDIFVKLDKKKIKTGILYDKIIPFSNIDAFTGDKGSKTVCLNTWKQIYYELQKANIDNNTQKLLTPISVFKSKRCSLSNKKSTINSIAILNAKYNKIKK